MKFIYYKQQSNRKTIPSILLVLVISMTLQVAYGNTGGQCIDGSCGADGHAAFELCVDENPNCAEWANNGDCEKSPEYMNAYCQASCEFCVDESDFEEDVEQQLDFGSKEDRVQITVRVDKMNAYFQNVINVNPKYKKIRGRCVNKHKRCVYGAVRGFCETREEMMILVGCAKACFACEEWLSRKA